MKEIGQEYKDLEKRKQFLEDNCDSVEEKSYMKPFYPEELQERMVEMSTAAIELSNIEEEFKVIKEQFKARMKPLQEKQAKMLQDIRQKAEYVTEMCYKFVDHDERMTTYYNAEGKFVEQRSCTASEMQTTLKFSIGRAVNE